MNNFEISNQIISDAIIPFKSNIKIDKDTYNILEKLIQPNEPKGISHLSSSEWMDLINTKNPIIYAGILTYQTAPPDIKSLALRSLYSIPQSTKKLLLPILFSEDKTILGCMTKRVSEKFINSIDFEVFYQRFKDYTDIQEDATTFPFSGTYAEEFLLKKSLDNSYLPLYSFKSYISKLVQCYGNPDNLEEEIKNFKPLFLEKLKKEYPEHLVNQNYFEIIEAIHNSMINNENIPINMRDDFFHKYTPVKNLKLPLYPSTMKEIYDAYIDLFNSDNKPSKLAEMVMTNLINHNLLPEECQLDLLDRYFNAKITIPMNLIKTLFEQTQYISVLTKPFSFPVSDKIIESVSCNEFTPKALLFGKCTAYVSQAIDDKHRLSSIQKNIILNTVRQDYYTPEFISKALQVFGKDKEDLYRCLALSPVAPTTKLNEIIQNNTIKNNIKAFAIINKCCSDKLDVQYKRDFLQTCYSFLPKAMAITDVVNPVFSHNNFFPKYNDEKNKHLRTILNEVINNGELGSSLCCSNYLNTLDKKDKKQKAKHNLEEFQYGKCNIKSFSIDELSAMKEAICEKVFFEEDLSDYIKEHKRPKHTPLSKNYYTDFLLYESLIIYSPLYNKINQRIQEINNEIKNEIPPKSFVNKDFGIEI